MKRRGSELIMRTRDRRGNASDFKVAWLIGGKRMQDTVTVFDDGRWQVLPVYFHLTGGGAWVDYNEFKQGAVTPDHPFFWTNFRRTANKECLECHTTGLDLRYDRTSQHWSTSFADAGVACEACHGPGGRHSETKSKNDIVRPDHLSPDLALAICARCHGPHEPIFPLLDQKNQFRPGQRYEDHYTPLVIADGTARSAEFFADGRPSSSSFEYQALLQSRCFMKGGATCLTCHSAPHEQHAGNELRSADPNASCVKCHAGLAPLKNVAVSAHSHHTKATCVDCHMPKVVSGVLDKFADHTLDIPNLDVTAAHGVPNACGVCHRDLSNEQLNRSAAAWWPQLAAKTARRTRLAAAIDESTAGSSLQPLQAVLADATESPSLRGACAELLGQRFPAVATLSLTPLLHDPDALVRARAVEALGYAQATGAAAAVAELIDDPSLLVRQNAALVLSSFRDGRALVAMQKLAADPATSGLVRPHIVIALAAAQRNDLALAERELRIATAQVPYATDALVLLADVHAHGGNMKAAREDLQEALRFDLQHKGARKRLAILDGPTAVGH